MDFQHSATAQRYIERLQDFMEKEVYPAEPRYVQHLRDNDPWTVPPVMEELKAKAREQGLWNLFLPDASLGAGLANIDYAPLAEITGRSLIAPEVFNCSAPDTGNMEVLAQYGSEAQRARWLTPLLNGEIRSAFAMTEPEVASSDATNMAATARLEGDEVVLNGRKWWTSGIGHPDCELIIFMGRTFEEDAPKHARHSMVLVPRDTPGVEVQRMLPVFGRFDEPHGHGEVVFNNVRLPQDHLILGAGRGFEIAQGRLGPGRIHHCMRCIGAAERALELLCERAVSREAFGRPLAALGGNRAQIADCRIQIEQARLLTLRAAEMMDRVGNKAAMSEIAQIKVVAPNVALTVIDRAIQMHGGAGVSDDLPLTALYGMARSLRLADGPDEVHYDTVGKLELKRYRSSDA